MAGLDFCYGKSLGNCPITGWSTDLVSLRCTEARFPL